MRDIYQPYYWQYHRLRKSVVDRGVIPKTGEDRVTEPEAKLKELLRRGLHR